MTKFPSRFRVWSPWCVALAVFISTGGLLLIISSLLIQVQPRLTHTLGYSSQQVELLWNKQGVFTQIATDGKGVVYAMPFTRESLMAIDSRNGTIIWKTKLPLERGGGARGLLANQNTVFVATSGFLDAYESISGELKWSTKLGDGHVSVIPQLDAIVLRVYYGDKLIELDPETGNTLTTITMGATTWVVGNVVLQASPANYLMAVNKQSDEILWKNHRLLHLDEGHTPFDINNDNLLVGFVRGICALDLQTGKYGWCRPEIDINKIAIDYQSRIGYGMREDLVLLAIDLQTGRVFGETKFLSSRPIDEQVGSVSAIAFGDGVVVISFSDSGQTFGLKISPLSNSSPQ